MNRKDFLYLLCAPVLGVAGVPFLAANGYARKVDKDTFLAGSIDLDSAARVGRTYVRQGGPEQKGIQKLADQLRKKFNPVNKGNFKAELQALNSRIRDDFGNGRTVLFHNWVLSETEIAFCVFAYNHKLNTTTPL